MDSLVAKFLPRFVDLARQRLDGAHDAVTSRQGDRAETIARDMHALAGEAGLLGFEEIVVAARGAEQAARRFGSTGADAEANALAGCVETLRGLVAKAGEEAGR